MVNHLSSIRDFFWILLVPLSWLANLASGILLRKRKPTSFRLPIISVGNLHLGGTGKTPLVIEIARHFSNKRVAVISRGYRGTLQKSGARVDLKKTSGPSLYGDEPWMIKQNTKADVFVGANRKKNMIRFEVDKNYDLAILDDGFQHRQIHRDINIVVVPAEMVLFQQNPLPLGNLREPISRIERATHIVLIKSESEQVSTQSSFELLRQFNPGANYSIATRSLTSFSHRAGPMINLEGSRVGAFCGVAHPERFKADVEKKMRLSLFSSFPDHYPYTQESLEKLIEEAKNHQVDGWITTEKDWVKISEVLLQSAFPFYVANLELKLSEEFWSSINQGLEKKW